MPDRRLRIVLAEDAALLREGLVGILERSGHEVVAAVERRRRPARLHRRLPAGRRHHRHPDAADPHRRGPARRRARSGPSTRGIAIMVLSAYVAEAYVPELLDSTAGASHGGIGYLLKDRVGHVREFLDSLDRVAAGGTVVDPEVVRHLLGRRRSDGPLAALHRPRTRGAGADGRGPHQRRDRRRSSSSARPRSASTWATSSPSSTSTRTRTAASPPSWPTCAARDAP